MAPAVLQALILFTFASIIWHNVSTKVFTEAENMDSWKNFTNAQQMLAAVNSENSTITFGETVNGTRNFNITWGNNNPNGTNTENSEDDEPFYSRTLPKEVLFMIIILPLQYMFQMWLERTFPGRARPSATVASEKDPGIGEGSDAQEDELIKRLIAQGKIRRSSLSWGNTFIKWVIDMTLGQIWKDHLLWTLLEAAWHRHAFKHIWSELKWGFVYKPWVGLFGFRPLASLLSFIIVPAHQRIVFLEGADLLWVTFLGIFMSTVIPWFLKTEMWTAMVGNMTEDASKKFAAHASSMAAAASPTATLPAIDAPEVRLGDEL